VSTKSTTEINQTQIAYALHSLLLVRNQPPWVMISRTTIFKWLNPTQLDVLNGTFNYPVTDCLKTPHRKVLVRLKIVVVDHSKFIGSGKMPFQFLSHFPPN
jgi:hypothetical protein